MFWGNLDWPSNPWNFSSRPLFFLLLLFIEHLLCGRCFKYLPFFTPHNYPRGHYYPILQMRKQTFMMIKQTGQDLTQNSSAPEPGFKPSQSDSKPLIDVLYCTSLYCCLCLFNSSLFHFFFSSLIQRWKWIYMRSGFRVEGAVFKIFQFLFFSLLQNTSRRCRGLVTTCCSPGGPWGSLLASPPSHTVLPSLLPVALSEGLAPDLGVMWNDSL